jgi:ketosteroid isomerase-like protein
MAEDAWSSYKEVAKANRDFYGAFERRDLAAMLEAWLPEERVKCVHPGWALLQGIDQVMDSWEAIFRNTESIRFELVDVTIEVLGDVAWVTNVEQIVAGDFRSAAPATNLFLRRGSGWKMLLHHASPFPVRD